MKFKVGDKVMSIAYDTVIVGTLKQSKDCFLVVFEKHPIHKREFVADVTLQDHWRHYDKKLAEFFERDLQATKERYHNSKQAIWKKFKELDK